MVKIWLAQFLLWLKYSWPFAKDVLWPVLKDGHVCFQETHDMLEEKWPRDDHGRYKTLSLPWAKFMPNLPGGGDTKSDEV